MVTTGYLERDVFVRDLKLHYQEWGNADENVAFEISGCDHVAYLQEIARQRARSGDQS